MYQAHKRVTGGPMNHTLDETARRMDKAVELLEAGVGTQHAGYQVYASVRGTPVLDAAGGTTRPGVAMEPTSVTLWFSAGKPVTAVAIAQLWERGQLGLDDRIIEYIPSFAAGKEDTTVRHVLTHTSGFPFADDSLHPGDWETTLDTIAQSPALWPAGTSAGYHGTAGHIVLGEVVRVVDGRPIATYAREEIFEPLGMHDSYVALTSADIGRLGDRLALIDDQAIRGGYLEFNQFNSEPVLTAVSPGNTCRGPARELGYLFEALVGGGVRAGQRILQSTTVEAMLACHRRGLVDQTFAANNKTPHHRWGLESPWGLGVELDGNCDIGTLNSSRVFASSGAFSSVAFGDPESGLAAVIVTTGLLDLDANAARLGAVADAMNRALGAEQSSD